MIHPASDNYNRFLGRGLLTDLAPLYSGRFERLGRWPRYVPIVLCAIFSAACGSSPNVYVERGNKFVEAGKFDDAVLQYQKAIQKSSTFGDAYYRLGLAELKRNQPVPAYRNFRRAIEI